MVLVKCPVKWYKSVEYRRLKVTTGCLEHDLVDCCTQQVYVVDCGTDW